MARPRSFSTQDAVEAATAVFWSRGYQETAISDLERATGLNRSSLSCSGHHGDEPASVADAVGD